MYRIIILTTIFLGFSVQILWSKPERIISLSPTATEMLFAIGAAENVIAVDSYSNFPSSAPLTTLSAFEPNLEAIALYKPDLVVISFDVGDLQLGLNSAGIDVLLLPAVATIEDAFEQILEIGRVTKNEINAENLVSELRIGLHRIISERKGKPKLKVYHELDEHYYSPSSSSFLGDIYNALGFENIADRADLAKTGYPKLSAEYILGANPEVIIIGGRNKNSAQKISLRPGWTKIEAIKNGLVITVDPDISGRWGPRLIDFSEQVVQSLMAIEND